LRGFQSVVRCVFRSIAFLVRESGACWRSGGFVVKLQVSVKVSTSESIGVLLQLRFAEVLGSLRISNRLIAGSIVAEGDFVRRTLVR